MLRTCILLTLIRFDRGLGIVHEISWAGQVCEFPFFCPEGGLPSPVSVRVTSCGRHADMQARSKDCWQG